MQERPRLHIKPSSFDHILEGLAIVCVLLSVGITFYFFPILPDRIPTHFNIEGVPDGYGSRTTLCFLVVLQVLFYGFLSLIAKYPHTFNYMTQITEENAYEKYRGALRFLRWTKLWILGLFAYINWGIIQTALGKIHGIGNGFDVIVFVSIGLGIGYVLYQNRR